MRHKTKPNQIKITPCLVSKSLASFLKSSEFFSDFSDSISISTLFRVASKIAVMCKFIVFPSLIFVLKSLILEVAKVDVFVSGKRTANILRISLGLPCWLSRDQMLIMILRPVVLVPRWIIFPFVIFFMDSIWWLYQTQRLFIVCASDTDVTMFSYSKRSLKLVTKEKK